jgi:putative transposase
VEQLVRTLTDPVDGFLRTTRYLIHDRDPLYTRVVTDILTSGGVQPIRLPPKSPNLNAYAERFVRSIKEECLTRVIRIGEGHMRLLTREYVGHYHRERNHQSELDSARSAGYVVGLRGPSQEVVWFVAFPLVRQWHWPLPW